MNIVPFYAALLALLFIYLSAQTIKVRRRVRVAVGDGGNSEMLRAMRVHANFAEYVPLTLVLLGMLELQASPAWVLHALGVLLLVARCSHAYGVSQSDENFRFRVLGMMGTFSTMGVAAGLLVAMPLIG
ncbi:MAG: glutathione metabolism protein [Burkholderiales bacterium 35-55-47]|jgi:uncharacterized membrane protein YecN with MAPEG domain|uniref:MAPEG family protein n=1 Tax=Limnohabitans sp. TaxID=1907725 RepID=UPI000BD0103B|nr:MAPEG family protein [Limnohabitans sp.]OYY18323.1 MAG: glutathione metabolism protein [Burkholderiales bacterium 35-55-47]OYZ72737.1 MAG: glutathione metabolism protein [Burkholderiales bacterium 24-55-52]OZA99159.1 MAG: glutathione metabolism protein [Burkholderiales bacterium 39-55-53]HQR87104.1 MAPEG family protein [Limnohabitans sp.]HQS27848.1 MAPEG family protein [Limnohabitans sp.]